MPQPSVASAKSTITGEKGEIFGGDPKAQQPSFPGPGADATAPSPAKPHSSKILNQLDPRFSEGLLEANKKEREQTRQDEEQLMEAK